MLTRKEIADWIYSRDYIPVDAGQSDLCDLMSQSLRQVMKGDVLGCDRLAAAAIAFAESRAYPTIQQDAVTMNERKGKDYAPGSDILENFYRVADTLGISPTYVWGVYVAKHVEAVRVFCNTGALTAEPVEGRLVDIVVYAALGFFIQLRERGLDGSH